ncbi:MAG: hypothetical protein ICV59_05555 [Thermoleophilia bacterium]|nr:hypothetical protein [Thermoleophilia bacterium]
MLDEPRDSERSDEAEDIDELMDEALPEQIDRESIEDQPTSGPGMAAAEGGESGAAAEV